MDWPEISEVLAIKPVTDERKQREWMLKGKNRYLCIKSMYVLTFISFCFWLYSYMIYPFSL